MIPTIERTFSLLLVLSGMCMTKLDVLDTMETISICTGYELDGKQVDFLPSGAEEVSRCKPIYIEMPGWQTSTEGMQTLEELPEAARQYLDKLEELVGAPITIISTGPDRKDTIVKHDPFA